MKKEITKIWGVGLTLVLVISLMAFAAPVSAGTLYWSDETIPSTSGKVLLPDSNVTDIAVAAGDDVIYATIGSYLMYRSSDSGESWSEVTIVEDTTNQLTGADLVAVTPDDENYIAAANDTTVFISDDAGATWDSLGSTGFTYIHDLAISMEKSGNHFVAIAGEIPTTANVSYYEIGGVGADWTDAYTGNFTPATTAAAVAFSPNFASDEVMLVVTGSVNNTELQIFSFDQKEWNDGAGFGTDYPVALEQDDPFTTLDSASIALSPDYLGSDDSMRLAFVGLTVDGGISVEPDTSGIQRVDDDSNTTLKEEKHIHSIAYDGTNLVAGRYNTTTVYRCADPLASSPSVSGSAGLKSPGGENRVVVAWAGTDVVAGTTGDESAFAVSRSNGKSFNDISLIDTTLDALSDVAVSADGSNVYLVSSNETAAGFVDISVWRLASSWERVISVDNVTDTSWIVRTAPDDMDVIYVADVGGRTIYYSTDAGETKWHTRISTYNIEDLAIETDGDVAYVLTGPHVSKSTNSGFTWATKKSHKLTDGGNMITSLGEDLLLVGGDDGNATYSTDGNSSWNKLADGIDGAFVQVVAEGLEEGDLVWAVTSTTTADTNIYRWDWDDEEWDDEGNIEANHGAYGIALQDGVLYVVTSNGTDSQLLRSLNPTADDPDWNIETELTDNYTATPSALRVSVSDGIVKLWAIDVNEPDLASYKDTLALAGPTLIIPKMGFNVPMNPVTGEPLMVTFSWNRPSDNVDGYDLVIAYDDAFDETVTSFVIADDSSIVTYVADVAWNYDTTYYWHVRADAIAATVEPDSGDAGTYGPVRSPFSETRSFRVETLEVIAPVEVAPVPEITVTIPPAPSITLPAPEIIIPTPEIVLPAPQITLPPAPAPVAPIPGWALYAIIFIGAVLVIALIVLILRTRRPV